MTRLLSFPTSEDLVTPQWIIYENQPWKSSEELKNENPSEFRSQWDDFYASTFPLSFNYLYNLTKFSFLCFVNNRSHCSPVQGQYLCTFPPQEKTCFHYRVPRWWKQVFSCWEKYTGKSLFSLQGWACSAGILPKKQLSKDCVYAWCKESTCTEV